MRTYRPAFDVLEDRTVPTLIRVFPAAPVLPPATHLQVIVPQDVESGKPFNVLVSALDASNHLVPTFKGTVQVKLATADASATLPASFTFAAADKGRHTFQVTLTATGAQTVKATGGAITGQSALTVDPAVTHFGVYAFGQAVAGSPTILNVVALDANNHTVAGYSGTVHFTSTDVYAILPANYTFNAADGGSHLFQTTFGTIGLHTLAVNATANGSILGAVQLQVLSPWYYPAFSYSPGYGNWGWGNPWF